MSFLVLQKMGKKLDNYILIPLSDITDEAREIAVLWGDEYFPGIAMQEKHKLASDIMNYAIAHQRMLPEPLTSEMWTFLLVNALRSLTQEQQAGLCFDLYERNENKKAIDEKIAALKK